ncbi:MAG: hypothetical protein J6W84_03560 [Bacteroidales bacterium]|nr:hypothetical protein [Bacteroidales bacterium]
MKGANTMAKWSFTAHDNGGKFQAFTVTAKDKPTAITKGIERATKKASGDITTWNCKLISA